MTMMIMMKQILTVSALAAVTVIAAAAIMPALLGPQEVYAPSGRRGDFQIAFVGTIMESQNPYASPYMLVLCDTAEANAAYADWKAGSA